ncbi:hypothetical protein GPECTOR_10g959 [Gonium pectorale]|uniref:Uncharacterized protein n=1 Tax=Gonium pectorale TaxID=33097 RepID=A0A150GR94_GONPE|nr:hypothetical protein GPECTOR_10g959 [Gonium pectorale]|eukprot:KXZ52327.1 hypothetical protein GPECTOR_10g959 [Gonium pectorale]
MDRLAQQERLLGQLVAAQEAKGSGVLSRREIGLMGCTAAAAFAIGTGDLLRRCNTPAPDMAAIRRLLESGVAPNIRDGAPYEVLQTPLHSAAELGWAGAAEALVKAGAHMDAADDRGNTPLHLAAGKGQFKAVSVLLRAGASPNQKNGEFRTPLHFAALAGDVAVARILLTHGADKHASDKMGRPAWALTGNTYLSIILS